MPTMIPQPGQPPAAPGAAGPATGQPPFGSSPATGPTVNKGHQAGGLQVVGIIVKLMEEAIPRVGASTEVGQDLLKALQAIAKHVPPGTVSPAGEKNQMEQMMMKQRQAGPQIAAMRAQQPGATPQQPPAPPTPPAADMAA